MLSSFLQENFAWQKPGFTVIETITYAVIALVILFLIFRVLKKLKVQIDLKFFISLFPFILLGASLRSFVDVGYWPESFWTVTPGIYLLVAGIFLLCFFICFFVSKKYKIKWWNSCAEVGVGLVILNFLLVIKKISLANAFGFLAIVGLFVSVSTALYFIFKYLKQRWATTKISFLPICAHMLDASATFIAADFFGGWEKHPLTRAITNLTGTAASLYFLKLLVLLPAIYLIQKEIKDKSLRNFLFIAIAVLGLAEGLRNLISLVLV